MTRAIMVLVLATAISADATAQAARPASQAAADRSARILADTSLFPLEFTVGLRWLLQITGGTGPAAFAFPEDREGSIVAVIAKYGRQDRIRVTRVRQLPGFAPPDPAVDSFYVFGRLALSVEPNDAGRRIRMVEIRGGPSDVRRSRVVRAGRNILADSSLLPASLVRMIDEDSTLNEVLMGPPGLSKAWLAVPEGERPRMRDIRRRYGAPERIVDESAANVSGGYFMTISRTPPASPALTLTVTVHYYGGVGLATDRSSGDDTVRLITNMHISGVTP